MPYEVDACTGHRRSASGVGRGRTARTGAAAAVQGRGVRESVGLGHAGVRGVHGVTPS